jgi:hypothetical protein
VQGAMVGASHLFTVAIGLPADQALAVGAIRQDGRP